MVQQDETTTMPQFDPRDMAENISAPPRGNAPQPVPAPNAPEALSNSKVRQASWTNLLTNFVWSLGSGLEARGKNPKSGVGEALTAPVKLQEMKQKEQHAQQLDELRMAQEERSRTASTEAMNKIATSQAELPLKLQQAMASLGLTQARTANTQQDTKNDAMPKPDKEIHTYTGKDNKMISIFQRPDGTTYERVSENEAKETPRNIDPLSEEGVAARIRILQATPHNIDPLSSEGVKAAIERAKEIAKSGGGRSTLFERIGEERYMDMIAKAADARAGITASSIEAYVTGVATGNISNLSQIPQVARGKVLERMAAGGGFIITATDREGIRKIDMSEHILDQLELYSRRVAADPTDIEADSVLYGLRQAASGIFSKGIFAEAGVLTDSDIKRVQSLIPGVVSSAFAPGISEAKFEEMHSIIDRAKSQFKKPVGTILNPPKPGTPAPKPIAPTVGATGGPDFVTINGKVVPNTNKVVR